MLPAKSIALFLLVFFAVAAGNGFAYETFYTNNPPPYQKPEHRLDQGGQSSGEAGELKRMLEGLAEELLVNLEDDDPLGGGIADGLLVCTFVDINKLYRTSSFGRYVAVQLMNEFQRNFYPVIDIRKSLSIMVQEKRGEFGLSRDPEEIAASHSAGAVLTGTYLVGESEIIVNAEIVDNKRARLLSSATVIVPRNALNNLLLKDSASIRKDPDGVIYMKRLEL
ncbi:MAG: FlgO family outer membrane protein [Pseudomonadota bacterium]